MKKYRVHMCSYFVGLYTLFFLLIARGLVAFEASLPKVQLGVDRFFQEQKILVKNKRVGLITNHTGVNGQLVPTLELFEEQTNLVAIFCPEHGLRGNERANVQIENTKTAKGTPVFSLHGKWRRPSEEMLKGIDILVYDIQEIGCRSYTYISTLFYVMEEAAKRSIPFIVLDRPNPMGGLLVDGPMLQDSLRSFLGYINIPYCHGMTIGELAQFFNGEYKIGCKLHVVQMKGWTRAMTYEKTNLSWIPTSPYIPEADTPFYYASTGILGGLSVVNIGIGYTLPFKVVGAPWIDAQDFATKLNAQSLPSVTFVPFYYTPFYGKFKGKQCEGVKIVITDPHKYRPLAVQYMLIGMLKSLYPVPFHAAVANLSEVAKTSFCKVNGNSQMLKLIQTQKYVAWKLIGFDHKERKEFLETRKKYLIYQ